MKMAEIKIPKDFKEISTKVQEFNNTLDKEFDKVSNYTVRNFHQIAMESCPNISMNNRLIAFNLYVYMLNKKQNTDGLSKDEIRQRKLFDEYNQSCFCTMKQLAEYIGYKDERPIRPAIALLIKMNLIIVKTYISSGHQKYAFFMLHAPNNQLCSQYPSEFKAKGTAKPKRTNKKGADSAMPKQTGKETGKVINLKDYKEFKDKTDVSFGAVNKPKVRTSYSKVDDDIDQLIKVSKKADELEKYLTDKLTDEHEEEVEDMWQRYFDCL